MLLAHVSIVLFLHRVSVDDCAQSRPLFYFYELSSLYGFYIWIPFVPDFFSPANVMKLLEIVRSKTSSPSTIAACINVGKRIGKVSVVAGNCYGFIGNRMLGPYVREAEFLLEEGCTPLQIDNVLKKFGFAMGVFEMLDLAGNDVGWRQRIERGLTVGAIKYTPPDYPGMRYCSIADKLCEKSGFGQKVGKGWYNYLPANPRVPMESPDTLQLIKTHRKSKVDCLQQDAHYCHDQSNCDNSGCR
jgi:3-hydroxyacyl-CoA dehydrogenase